MDARDASAPPSPSLEAATMPSPPDDIQPGEIGALSTPIQPYDWGSREFIARLQRRPTPSSGPEAELWIGDHPRAPSRLGDASAISLRDHIVAHPRATLGMETHERFGACLPFLAKILAAARPLSLQVHPDSKQAAAGFAMEERIGTPLSARERSYSDPHRKIELMIAIEPFAALCGFREVASLDALLAEAELPILQRLRDGLRNETSLSGDLFFRCRALDARERESVLDELRTFADRKAAALPEAQWIGELLAQYPGDPGAVAPLLLNLVRLEPGEGLFVQPGTLHSYLFGNGFEVMSSSDNVVRGGLTSKFVDQSALEAIALRAAQHPDVVGPSKESAGLLRYALDERGLEEFEVRVISIGSDPGAQPDLFARNSNHKPSVLVCIEGTAQIESASAGAKASRLWMQPGSAVWIPATADEVRLRAEGSARLFDVRVP
jgi:mannose-6-phosphate isomerase